jgi:ATP-dependent exoDNAse (exonuclease V) beta subunit
MTIHKAKGLEFDTVIVPGLGYPPRREDPRLLLWLERPRGHAEPDLLLAPIREASAEEDAIYEYLRKLDRAKEEHEAARLLYVAATRARARLHLVGQVEWKEAKSPQPKSRSLLEHLWPAVAPLFEQAARRPDAALQSAIIHPAAAPPVIRRLVSGWRLPALPGGVSRPPRVETTYRAGGPGDEVEFSWASETAKHIGTVVHRLLQAIVRDGLPHWNVERVERGRAVYRRDLAQLGVPESETESAAARVVEALSAVLTDERGRWVLRPHGQAESELRLTGVLEEEIVSVAIDRTFVDEAGTRWIVDYKTGVHEGGDVEGFLDREQERYRAQLERYAALMRAIDARPIRLGLYFPLLRGWREWG